MSGRDKSERPASTGGYRGAGHGGYASCAWRLIGLFRSQAGWLDLLDGRLRYSTPAGVVFDLPAAEVTGLSFPWYYFGGGLKLTAAGERYRLSFVLPNGAEYPTARAMAAGGDPAALTLVAAKAQDIGSGRKVAREWRRLLEGHTAG